MATPFPFVAGAVLTAAQLNSITELVINDKTASYTLVAGDAGEYVVMNSASATTITVNNSIFAASQVVYIVNKGTAATTITAGAGVTISTSGSLVVPANGSGRLLALSASAFIYEAGDGAKGILQVVSTAKTDTFTTTSSSFVDLTGLSVSITPSSTANKVLVVATVSGGATSGVAALFLRLVRGSTDIFLADAAGSRTRTTDTIMPTNADVTATSSIVYLDSPATTSATTYKLQAASSASGQTVAVNRSVNDPNTVPSSRTTSSITVLEVAP